MFLQQTFWTERALHCLTGLQTRILYLDLKMVVCMAHKEVQVVALKEVQVVAQMEVQLVAQKVQVMAQVVDMEAGLVVWFPL